MCRELVIPSALLAVVFAASEAGAQAGSEPGMETPLVTGLPEDLPEYDEAEDLPPEIPYERDLVGGHFSLAPLVSWSVPFGAFEAGRRVRDVADSGPSVGVELGYGVARDLVFGLWGQAVFLGDGCTDCSATSYAGGALLRYHLVQGVRFDPWLSLGMGFRMTDVEIGDVKTTYAGYEWLRFALGGDWYATRHVAFGPFAELDMGTYLGASGGDLGEGRAHYAFSIGLRGVVDVPGKK